MNESDFLPIYLAGMVIYVLVAILCARNLEIFSDTEAWDILFPAFWWPVCVPIVGFLLAIFCLCKLINSILPATRKTENAQRQGRMIA